MCHVFQISSASAGCAADADGHLQCVPQNETHVILNNLYSCKSVAIARDILMTLAIICIHNLPPHLSYVSTIPDITQKPKHSTDELKQRLIDTWDRIPQGIIEKTSGKHGCVHV